MAVITICRDFGAPQNEISHCFHCFTIYLPWSDGARCHDLSFNWTLSFKPTFSLSSFTFINRLFNSFSLSAIQLVSSTYLRLLLFLPAILIPVCASSSLAFHMSAYLFTVLKIFCVMPVHPSYQTPSSWWLVIFLLSLHFCLFQNVTEYGTFTGWLLSLSNRHESFFQKARWLADNERVPMLIFWKVWNTDRREVNSEWTINKDIYANNSLD